MILQIGGKTRKISDLRAASETFVKVRGNRGASSMPDGYVFDGGQLIARVSYNGRVWAEPAVDGAKPIFDPFADR